jgi:hypothetical protein
MADHPHTRAATVCPLCGAHKPRGLLACRPCHNAHSLGDGNPHVESRLADYERALAGAAARKAGAPLKPAAPQEACDVGLFSDDARQLTLI